MSNTRVGASSALMCYLSQQQCASFYRTNLQLQMHSKALVFSCTYNQAKHGVDSYAYASVQQNAYRLQQHSVRPRQVMSNPTTVCWLGAHVGATNPAATKR
jgi:hypothetical protein